MIIGEIVGEDLVERWRPFRKGFAGRDDGVLSDLVVLYLFLGGAGAGACFWLAVMGLRTPTFALSGAVDGPLSPRCRLFSPVPVHARLFVRGQATALVLLVVGTCCLAVDLGRPDRALLLFLQPAPTMLSFGAWSLASCAAAAAVVMFAWCSAFRGMTVRALRVLSSLQAVAGAFTMVYTGLLLGSLAAVPLWHSAWLPALFTLSSLSCGLAVVCASGLLGGSDDDFASLLQGLMRTDVVVIVIEAAVLAGLVACACCSGATGANATQVAAGESIALLLEGPWSGLFWAGFVGAGMVLPLALEVGVAALRARAPLVMLAACACVLAGGLALRYCFVAAGVHPAIVTM